MTKLSLVLDQEIKCCILWSSSMLHKGSVTVGLRRCVREGYLYNLWMKAALMAFGCCAAAAAPTAC
jgi:hypothetical protein